MLGRRQTPYHRFGVWLTKFVPGVYFMRYVWTPIDRLVYRLRGGRHGVGPRALPFMMLTTIGRTTGLHRSTPVLYFQDGPSYVIVGSNYGRRGHPAWTHNLIATPQATVQIGDRFESVLAGGRPRMSSSATGRD